MKTVTAYITRDRRTKGPWKAENDSKHPIYKYWLNEACDIKVQVILDDSDRRCAVKGDAIVSEDYDEINDEGEKIGALLFKVGDKITLTDAEEKDVCDQAEIDAVVAKQDFYYEE